MRGPSSHLKWNDPIINNDDHFFFSVLRQCSRCCWACLTPSYGPPFLSVVGVLGGGGVTFQQTHVCRQSVLPGLPRPSAFLHIIGIVLSCHMSMPPQYASYHCPFLPHVHATSVCLLSLSFLATCPCHLSLPLIIVLSCHMSMPPQSASYHCPFLPHVHATSVCLLSLSFLATCPCHLSLPLIIVLSCHMSMPPQSASYHCPFLPHVHATSVCLLSSRPQLPRASTCGNI